MFGAPFSPKRAACGAQRRPRRCGRQICRFFFSRSPSSPCAADPSAASAAIVTDLRCRRGKIHDSSSKKCFDGFAGNFWYFGFFRRLLLFFVLCQRHALSVTFGDTSPIGRGTGVPVRPTRDEQSLRCPKTVVPCGLDSQQLDKVLLSRSRCPRKQGPPFCALLGLMRPAQSGPARQWLPLWGSWHRAAMTERATAGRALYHRAPQNAA